MSSTWAICEVCALWYHVRADMLSPSIACPACASPPRRLLPGDAPATGENGAREPDRPMTKGA